MQTNWIKVQSEGAAPATGWRCDKCGSTRWGDDEPITDCDVCVPVIAEAETTTPKPSRRSRPSPTEE